MKIMKLMKRIILLLLMLSSKFTMAQKIDTLFIEKLLSENPQAFKGVLNHPTKNEVQILYTQVKRDKNNRPSFNSFGYRLDPSHYFYPASTVKLAAVIFALEKVNDLKIKGLNANTWMITDSAFTNQTTVNSDPTAESGKPSIAHYVKKILLTSDNDAFNRLFEFIGRAEINDKLKKYGCLSSRIINRLAIGDSGESTRHSNPIHFYKDDELIYSQPAQYDPRNYELPLNNLIVGKGYMDAKEQLIMQPFNFADKNAFTIVDQQSLLRRLMMPEAYPKHQRFNLRKQDYDLIYTYMSMLPFESKYPKYDQKEFFPYYAKMLYFGRDKKQAANPNIRSFNKYGDSYGFIIDNAYVVDFKNKIEFFLTAVVQSNEDGIYNDNKYEYEQVCYPFMKNLGETIYQYELARKKTIQPKLKKFKLKY